MTITKVSHNPKDPRTRIEWIDEAGQERSVTSRQRPHPDLVDALAALRPVVIEACMIGDPNAENEDRTDDPVLEHLTVRGLTTKALDDADGVTITALREVDWTAVPLVLNTPFAPIELLPSPRASRLVEAAVREAALFVGGKRAKDEPGLFDDAGDLDADA